MGETPWRFKSSLRHQVRGFASQNTNADSVSRREIAIGKPIGLKLHSMEARTPARPDRTVKTSL